MSLADLTIKEFLNELSSDSPAPGGGSVAALSGALGSGLVTMVSRLTVGREKYLEHWAEMSRIRDESRILVNTFLDLMHEDTIAFNTFMEALKLPKDTVEEKEIRGEMMQNAMKKATEIPLRTLSECVKLIHLAVSAVRDGNPNAVTDAGTAALLARSGAESAAYNISINLAGIKDLSYTEKVKERMDSLLLEIEEEDGEIRSAIRHILTKY